MGNVGRKKGAGRKKETGPQFNDPAAEPNALGYRFLPDRSAPKPKPLVNILPSLLAKYGGTRRLTLERFYGCWEKIRKEVLLPSGISLADDDGIVSGFRGGTLSIVVTSAVLMMELSFHEREILSRFQAELPKEKIRKIRFIQK